MSEMAKVPPTLSPSRTTCGSLLRELQIIWDEIGESDSERDKMLLQLEQECLDIYRRKVEKTRKYKADLHQQLAEAETEIAGIASALGEGFSSFSRGRGTLKEQVVAIKLIREELRSKKCERLKEFSEVQAQVVSICSEIAGSNQSKSYVDPQIDERDLTAKKLGELKLHLQELQSEKHLRLQKVNSNISLIHELSVVMSVDFLRTVNEVHPSLGDPKSGPTRSISNDTLARLAGVIHSLKQDKQERLLKLQVLGKKLTELWNLMDAPSDDRKKFDHVTCLMSSSIDEVSGKGCLAIDVIEQVEVEVERLNILKTSKMRELIFKRQTELEEIYRGVHMDIDSNAARTTLTSLIDSGNINLSDLLSSMDDQVVEAKEQALSRKDILDKVEKWQFALQEEKWLDDYERDDNRYSAGRGAHKNLKRAEKARTLLTKLPSMVENLVTKVKAWEAERGITFTYEKVPLLRTLEEDAKLRHEREEEKRKSREQKRLQEQLASEQEALYGSKPLAKKPLGQNNTLVATPGRRVGTPGRYAFSGSKDRRESVRVPNIIIPVNYVALPKDDSASKGG
ncbi:65-kDa microtubule-associated protein 5 [Momordica charantia]|uniref:65-kDa microtubule-associated protein 5 n=1 Tax=Momordica charantia TaxID=3673 RepID=A0A6J1CB20_MOMCH|nr:65-kDa microtubule-associated protein 5 [Momordica charantia]